MDRYKFSTEIKRDIAQLCKLNNLNGAIALGFDFAIILISILLSQHNHCFYPLSLLLIGSRQRALATILHEAAHGTLAKSKWLNKFLGTYLSGYLIFQTWNSYKKSHVVKHHHKLGIASQDPDYIYYLNTGVYDTSTRAKFVWRYLAKPLLFLNAFSSLNYLIKNRPLSEASRIEIFPMMLSLAIFATIGGLCFGLESFLIYWLIPYLTTFQMFTWFIELAEHYPMVRSAREDIGATRNRFSHAIEHFLTGMHNEHFHLVHHLFPGVPFWKLKQAHHILLRDEKYARINAESGGIFLSGNFAPSMWHKILKGVELKWAS